MMKKTLAALIAASVLTMAVPATAQAGWFSSGSDKTEQGCKHKKGDKGLRGDMRGMRELKLTDKQKQQVREIHLEQRATFHQKMDAILTPEQRAIAAKHEAERKAMREERRADKK
ncbi:MAG: hypothetical protein ABIM24_02710 [Paraperlucidibaca sp.]